MADQLPLNATGNPMPIAPQQQQAPLSFAAPPQQAPGSNLLGLLSSIAGLGLNIAGAATRTGAAGQGSLAFGEQQMQQAAKNSEATQKQKNEELEGQAVYNRAKAAGLSGTALEQIKTLAQNRQTPQAREELNRELSVLRSKQAQDKADAVAYSSEAQQAMTNLNSAIKTHPAAVPDFLSNFAAKLPDDEQPGNIAVRLQTEGRKAGVPIDQKAAKQYAKDLVAARNEALASRKTGGLPVVGWGASDVPQEKWLSTGDAFKNKIADQAGLTEYQTLVKQRNDLKPITEMLRAKAGSERSRQGMQALDALRNGQAPEKIRVQDLKSGQTGTIDAHEFDPKVYKKL